MSIKLIADGGSTGVKWCLLDGARRLMGLTTTGINPSVMSPDEIAVTLSGDLLPALPLSPREVDRIYYYGAGCRPGLPSEQMAGVLAAEFTAAEVSVESDMVGAARALLGSTSGIACILGTGSNSCYFDGTRIADSVSSLGYILGDEGSGASLGKALIASLLRGRLPRLIADDFARRYPLDADEIICRVYRQASPNRFLASFAPFVADNLHHPSIRRIALEEMQRFVDSHLTHYRRYDAREVHFVGSIAVRFREILAGAASSRGFSVGLTLSSALDGLIDHHSAAD